MDIQSSEPKPGGPRVKGLAFRTVLSELEKHSGAEAVQRALALMPENLAARIRTRGMSAVGWYPIEHYVLMWNAIQEATGQRRELPRLIGRLAVEHDLNIVHKMVFKALSTATVISLATRIFSAYYDTGQARAEMTSNFSICVNLTGCTGFSGHMWEELRGSVEIFAERASSAGKSWSSWKSGGKDGVSESVLNVFWK